MKKLFAILLLITAPLHAQQSDTTVIKISVPCGPQEEVAKMITKYEERPLLQMISERQTSKDSSEGYVTILFANPKTQSYTIIEQVSQDMYCVTGSGKGLIPYMGRNEAEKKEKSPRSSKQDNS